MLGLDDDDSMDKMEISPPPLSPQAPPAAPLSPGCKPGKSQISPSLSSSPPDNEKSRKLDKCVTGVSAKHAKSEKKSLETSSVDKSVDVQVNGSHDDAIPVSDSDNETSQTDSKQSKQKIDSDKSSCKKRKKGEGRKAKSKELVATTDSESESEKGSTPVSEESNPAPSSKTTALENIPSDMRFEPKNLLVKPKGLVDALSNFFTPGLKRTSRTAMNSLIKPESSIIKDSKSSDDSQSEVKKVRLSVEEKEESSKSSDNSKLEERKRHASAGQQQVKSLYDGLSHLYNDCDSRLRSAPKDSQKEPKERESEKKTDENIPDTNQEKEEGKKDKSPQRLSDSDSRQDKNEEKKADVKTEEEDKIKGSSKNQSIFGMIDIFY